MFRSKYLFYFAQEHVEFRIPELKGVASLLNIDFHILDTHDQQVPDTHYQQVPNTHDQQVPDTHDQQVPDTHDQPGPFVVLDVPREDLARKLVSRTVLVRSLFELWAAEKNYTDLNNSLKRLPAELTKQYMNKSSSFKFHVDSYGRNLTQKQKLGKIDHVLEDLCFEGTVNLRDPDHAFHILEEYHVTTTQPHPPDEPKQIYFGRWLSDGHRSQIHKYSLKNRKFIGNTSMDAGLSLVMSNIGRARPGTLVLDPFVGSGGLLVSSAHFGSHVMGAEINYKLLHGTGKSSRSGTKWRSRDENIRSNLAQYDLEQLYIDVMVADSSRNMWRRSHALFDAIITDPPYGIREATRKTASDGTDNESAENSDTQSGSLEQYHISQVFTDLLNFSARYLVLGGRLVYWYPVYRPEYVVEHIPQHPCLTLVANCEQLLHSQVSRRLLTMEKTTHTADDSILDSAFIPADPFKEESFRDKYYAEVSEKEEHKKPEKALLKSACKHTVNRQEDIVTGSELSSTLNTKMCLGHERFPLSTDLKQTCTKRE